MNLLMMTRKIDRDDALAGHSYEWARKISSKLKAQSSKLMIICLEKGNTTGLGDAALYSLGKETKATRLSRFWKFQKLASRLVKESDGVFCHQNPEYAIIVAPWAGLYRKKIVSWYTHKSVTWKTKAMLAVSEVVLTASKESFRLSSPKVRIVGHGIDTQIFYPDQSRQVHTQADEFEIATVGRIAPVKDLETLILAIAEIKRTRPQVRVNLRIVGEPIMSADFQYLKALKKLAVKTDLTKRVRFEQGIPHAKIFEVYQAANLFVNLSQTGSLDKAVLEAMACECPVITANEAFFEMLRPLGEFLITEPNDAKTLAKKIMFIKDMNLSDYRALGANLRNIVVRQHNLDNLALKIIDTFKS